MACFQVIEHDKFRIGLWSIVEPEERLRELAQLSVSELAAYSAMNAEKRRRQWLGVRALLCEMEPTVRPLLQYDIDGKPLLENVSANISISHSDNMVAIQLSPMDRPCGIDIQSGSEKIERLAPKFINDNESAFIPAHLKSDYLNLVWTMKEAIFKHFGSGLEFKGQIRIQPFDMEHSNVVTALAERDGEYHSFRIRWQRIDQYFLSYLC